MASTVMSCFNVWKYSPALLFVLITFGVSLLCLLAFRQLHGLLRACWSRADEHRCL
jgi:hypothetical protein